MVNDNISSLLTPEGMLTVLICLYSCFVGINVSLVGAIYILSKYNKSVQTTSIVLGTK